MYVCMYVCMYVFIYLFIYLFICLFVCLSVCLSKNLNLYRCVVCQLVKFWFNNNVFRFKQICTFCPTPNSQFSFSAGVR